MRVRNAVFAGCAALAVLLTGCQEKKAGEKRIVIKVGDNWGETHPVAAALDRVFKTQVEKGIPGAVVDVYHNGALGNEADLWNGVRSGAIEIAVVGTPFNQEWRQGSISDWPFLYRDIEHAKKVWASPVADDLNRQFHDKFPEVYMLAWGPNSARTFTSSKPLTKFEDFKGQKFRMPDNPIHVEIAEALGASAQVIPLGELYRALETRVVDGQDNGMVTFISRAFYEVQKYVYETNHIISTLEVVAGAGFMNGLSAEQRDVVRDAAKAAMASAWDTYIAALGEERAFLRGHGVTVTECAPADREKIEAALKPLMNRLLVKNPWAPTVIEKIKAVK